MKKAEFIKILTAALKERHISDLDEIVSEYSIFFDQKLADGHSEEEIASRLGDPKTISEQFEIESPRPVPIRKILVGIGMILPDFFVAWAFLLLFSWVIVMAAGAGSSLALGGFLLFDLNINNLIPAMPDLIRIIFGVVALELSVLFVIGTWFFWLFVRQLLRSFIRFHKNLLARAGSEGILPSIPIYPQLNAARKRRMRTFTLIVITVLVITILSGYLAAAVTADSLEFWHVWGWFGYL
jgi:hypothetical protein